MVCLFSWDFISQLLKYENDKSNDVHSAFNILMYPAHGQNIHNRTKNFILTIIEFCSIVCGLSKTTVFITLTTFNSPIIKWVN